MKKNFTALGINLALNICWLSSYPKTNQHIETQWQTELSSNIQHIDSIKFQELFHAINQIDIQKIKLLASKQIAVNILEKNALLKKIDTLIYSNKKSAILKLLFGIPLTGIGLKFFYFRFKYRRSSNKNMKWIPGYLDILESGNYRFSIIDNSFKEILQQIFCEYYGKIAPNGHVNFNLPVLFFVIACSIYGSKLTINGLKQLVFKLSNLRKIQKLIKSLSVEKQNNW